jgi:hypothetical protein
MGKPLTALELDHPAVVVFSPWRNDAYVTDWDWTDRSRAGATARRLAITNTASCWELCVILLLLLASLVYSRSVRCWNFAHYGRIDCHVCVWKELTSNTRTANTKRSIPALGFAFSRRMGSCNGTGNRTGESRVAHVVVLEIDYLLVSHIYKYDATVVQAPVWRRHERISGLISQRKNTWQTTISRRMYLYTRMKVTYFVRHSWSDKQLTPVV